MKRSEMVNTIAISLMSRLPEWEKEERRKFASEILQDLEIEGMLPPTLEKVWMGAVIDEFNEWEPEEEE